MQCRLSFLLLLLSSLAAGQPTTVGTAYLDAQGCYTLTTNGSNQGGAVWFEDTLDLTRPFVIDGEVTLGANNSGADGMTIALMNNPGNSIGLVGQNLGYGSLSNAFAVEIDVYQNGGTVNDPVYDHVAYLTNGSVIHTASPSLSAPVSCLPSFGNVENQNFYQVQLYWYPSTQTLDFYFDCNLRLSRTVDLLTLLGTTQVQWGATAATGALTATFRFCKKYAANFTNDTIQWCNGTIQPNYTAPNIQSYYWSPAIGVSDTATAAPILSPPQTTTYTIIRTDSCGTERHDTLTILAFSSFDPLPPVEIICEGDSVLADLTGFPNLLWSDGSASALRYLSQPGTYYVTATDPISGCTAIDSLQLYVAELNLQASNQQVCYNDIVTLSANPPFAVHWADFDSGLPAGWSLPDTTSYLYEQMAGPFRNDTVEWNLTGLPEHDELVVEFTLYIFDDWDGNGPADGPDLWGMQVDGTSEIHTTFSNTAGTLQSYPDDFQINHPAMTNALHTGLPPRCASGATTTIYQMQFILPHSACDASVKWYGELIDAASGLLCDESWALDNVIIRTNSSSSTSLCPPAFMWSNGATATTFDTAILDTITFTYTADFGGVSCEDSITVNVLNELFDPFLDSAFICWDHLLTLNAGSGYLSYLWNTGDTTQSIILNAGGWYSVETSSSASACLGYDSIWVERISEPLLQTDIALCFNDSLRIDLTNIYGPDYQITWGDGSTGPVYSQMVSASDTISVQVSHPQLTCIDSMYLFASDFELPDDSTIWCPNEPLSHSAPQGAASYLWSTSDTTAQTTFLAEGWYHVTITAGNCIKRDSIWHDWFQVYDDIVPDSMNECGSYTLDLSMLPWTSMQVEPGGLSGNQITLDQSDEYYLSGIDINGCPAADTMMLWIGEYPEVEIYIEEDCPTTRFMYVSSDPTGSSGWTLNGDTIPGTTLDTVIQEDRPLYLIAWLNNYCDTDSTFATYEPGCFLQGAVYIPNAFTPNGDLVNDIFRPQGNDFQRFKYQIFDRWGRLVYTGTDADDGWDGTVNGEPVILTTVFVVRVVIWYTDGSVEEERTTLRLIR